MIITRNNWGKTYTYILNLIHRIIATSLIRDNFLTVKFFK
jgi:hypothetical protein